MNVIFVILVRAFRVHRYFEIEFHFLPSFFPLKSLVGKEKTKNGF